MNPAHERLPDTLFGGESKSGTGPLERSGISRRNARQEKPAYAAAAAGKHFVANHARGKHAMREAKS